MINRIDFASEVPLPDNHHTAHAVRCFCRDPYVYYQTYIQDKLPKPPVIRNQAEMLFKYKLLCGLDKFDERFDTFAPVNPNTGKPYGDDTNKFIEWAKKVRSEGKIPVHPSVLEKANEAYSHTKAQIDGNLLPLMSNVVGVSGRAGLQAVATIDNSKCYANIDFLSDQGTISKVMLIPSLDRLSDAEWVAEEFMFPLVFQYVTLKEAIPSTRLNNVAIAVVAEYLPPFRVANFEVDVKNRIEIVLGAIQKLNKKIADSKDNIANWQSPYHLYMLPYNINTCI